LHHPRAGPLHRPLRPRRPAGPARRLLRSFFFQAEDGIRDFHVTGVQTCALPISSKLDAYAERLSAWLRAEANKPRKQKRTIKQLHADLMCLGYEGSYGRVSAFARAWKEERQRQMQSSGRCTSVLLAFDPGEAFQFDWSEDWAVIGGERTKLQVAHLKLSYSRAFIVRAYPLQTHEMLFDAHNHAFRVLGGVPRRGIYDNMRTAVDRIGRGKERQ